MERGETHPTATCTICKEPLIIGEPAIPTKEGFVHTECFRSPFEKWARSHELNREQRELAKFGWDAAMEHVASGRHAEDKMERAEFHSSALNHATYGRASKRLFVTFTNGAVWRYDGVPGNVWDEFRKAESAGHYYTENVKGHYPSLRMKSE